MSPRDVARPRHAGAGGVRGDRADRHAERGPLAAPCWPAPTRRAAGRRSCLREGRDAAEAADRGAHARHTPDAAATRSALVAKTLPTTRVPKKRRAGAPPDSVLRPCPSCGIEHQRFARCADRVLRTNSRISAKAAAELEREPAMTDAQVADVIATPAPDVAGTP